MSDHAFPQSLVRGLGSSPEGVTVPDVGVGTLPVEPPLTGQWPFDGFPASVQLEGVTFNRALWEWPLYSGVIAQFRQAVPTNAMHLLVYRNGFYEISHVDEINPDLGSPLAHAAVDAPLATTIACAVGGGLLGLVVGLLIWRNS